MNWYFLFALWCAAEGHWVVGAISFLISIVNSIDYSPRGRLR